MTITPEAQEILGLYFPILDHGFCALVDAMGGDHSIVQAARVSYGAGTKKVSEDRGLIRYLMRHRHTTPLEMVELKFHMKLPIFVARQLVRHRTASLNEYSGRYSLMPMQFYTPEREQLGLQSTANRQGRSNEILDEDGFDDFVTTCVNERARDQKVYEDRLNRGIAREISRIDLPLSLYTEWYWKMNLHNLFHFMGLRSDSHAQWEIRQMSDAMAGMVKRVAPLAFEAWTDFHPHMGGAMFSRRELIAMEETFRTGKMSEDRLAEIGLSKREIGEYQAKTKGPREVPSFDLDPSTAKPPGFFYEQAQEAVPNVDQA